MTKARSIFVAIVFSLTGSAVAQSGLGLMVNDQLVVPAGQLKHFSYEPGTRKVNVQTFFGDIRCETGAQSGTGEPISVEIDKFSDLESTGEYQVFSGGAVEYFPSDKVVNIAMADTSNFVGCTHQFKAVGAVMADGNADPGAFWVSDFSSPIRVTGSTPSTSAAVLGSTLTVKFAVENISKLLVATDLEVDLDLPDLSGLGITGPTFSGAGAVNNGTWAVTSLWPDDDPATLSVSYEIPNETSLVGKEISVGVAAVRASDRTRARELAVGDVGVTVLNTTTAP